MTRVGFIGLGKMGSPMAGRLVAAGHALTVLDASPDAVTRFLAEHPGGSAASPRGVAERADVVVTMLPTSAIVADVLHGTAGLLAGLKPGTLLVEMSSGVPATTRLLAEEVARGAGGVLDRRPGLRRRSARALTGELKIMVGGPAEAVERAEPLLAAMGTSILPTGAVGTAHAMKALNNLVSATAFLASVEALLIGKRFGLDPAVMVDVLNASTGMNNSTQKKLKQFVLSRAFNSGFGLELMVKDLTIALGIARDGAVAAPLSSLSRELWASALASQVGPDHTDADTRPGRAPCRAGVDGACVPYEVYAIRYARHERTARANFIGGDEHDGPMPLDYFVWLVRGDAGTFVVDTGFDAPVAAARQRQLTTPVGDGLAALGVDPAQRQDVIVTHMHYDHAGNHALFPRARYHLQDDEMAFCTGRCMTHAALRHAYAAEDVGEMVRKVFDGRVAFHAGGVELAPGLSACITSADIRKGFKPCGFGRGGAGSCWPPTQRTSTPTWTRAGRSRSCTMSPRCSKATERCASWPCLDDLVIPGHDPLVLRRFPARLFPDLAGHIARLDADPMS